MGGRRDPGPRRAGAPRLTKAIGRVKVIVVTHTVGIALLIALPFASSYLEASAIFVLRNAAMNMANPLFSSLVVTIIPEEERARGVKPGELN